MLRYSVVQSFKSVGPSFTPRAFVHVVVACVTLTGAVIPGTDPTGVVDSSTALNVQLRKLCDANANSIALPVTILDLESGIYRLDSPLSFNASVTCTGMYWYVDSVLYTNRHNMHVA